MQLHDTTDNLYHNDGDNRFARIHGSLFKWVLGKGWETITEDKLPINITWSKLPDTMLAIFEPEFPK